ncbi:MAG: hypothetical protein A2X32_05135 [Elusimicrobia bacterium GWC2_64_44]|nr:MAG: hypothetical protein A2X32_05135 [Elusimicrobia bacterium GWC2_64_44]
MTSARTLFTCGRAALLASLALFPLFAGRAQAVIAPTINYQGFLLSKVTNEAVDAPQDLKFLIYGAATGGAPLFTENRCNLRVSKGRYDVEIGSSTPGGIPGGLFMDYTALWLEVQVDSDNDCSGAYEPMTPRVKLQASPYAFNSLYASTASAATTVFSADIIAALPNTTYGAITISTNLFVQGGISVGSISPGQKLAVAGVVESTGNWPSCATAPDYTCGFKFPDGSVQVKAAALTMWDVLGLNLYTINEGNTNIGGGITNPLARLHISSAPGAGDLLLISTGPTPAAQAQLFRVNADGQVYGGSFYGDGSTLGNIVRKGGDTMTGQLTMGNSSFTVTSPLGATIPKLRLGPGVEISSAPASVRGGLMISSHVYLSPGATYYGDGSGLYNLTTQDSSKVLKAGDTMTGQLTLLNSTLTVTGDAFSVTGSTFSVFGGSVAVGGYTYPVRLSVTGGILATSSITAQGGLFADNAKVAGLGQFYNVTAASGTFWSWDTMGAGYSVDTASGIKVRAGIVDAPYFVGNGSLLTAVQGTDSSRLLKAGDTMTGNLRLAGSSVTIADNGAHYYALTVATAVSVNNYSLAVTTGGRVGVQVNNPDAPLEVNEWMKISNPNGLAHLDFQSFAGSSYLSWKNTLLSANGPAQGALGYPTAFGRERDFVYRAMGTSSEAGGQEVFRITSDDFAYWRFGIGTSDPAERFHVVGNVLVSTAATNPIFFVSTTTDRVGIRTLAPTHALTVEGGISAVSSITAQGGFFGNGAGLTGLSASAIPQTIVVASVTALGGGTYDGVVFSTTIYATSKLSVGTDSLNDPFDPLAALHVRGPVRLDQKTSENVELQFYPNFGGDSLISWSDPFVGAIAALGVDNVTKDMVYRSVSGNLTGGSGVFRIKYGGGFIIGVPQVAAYAPPEFFRVLTNMAVGVENSPPVVFISTGTGGWVGISTGTPKERFHVGSSLLVGGDRAGAALYVSTQTGYTGVGTGSPAAKLNVAGYALFNSSLTVLGGGLAGTEDVLNVKSGALLVRNDGRVGIGAALPAATLDVNGTAQFGSGVNKSTFTAEGFWMPRSLDTAALQAASPPSVGAVVFNSSINDLCVSTGTAVGQWALAGSKGLDNCFN